MRLEPLRELGLRSIYPVAWLDGNRIVFSGVSGDSRNHWVATLSNRDWQIDGAPQRLTFGGGVEGPASVAMAGGILRLAFSNVLDNVDLWSVPLSRDGLQSAGAPVRLTQDAATDVHPTLSTDAKLLIYSSDRQRRRELWARDLITGREAPLVSMPPSMLFKPVISQDGSKLAFWRQEGAGLPSATFVTELSRSPDGSVRAGATRELPSVAKEGSGWPWSWSPSGESVWYDPARWPRVAPNFLYSPQAGRLAEFGHPEHDLSALIVSPDGRWVAFRDPVADNAGRLVIAPIAGGVQPAGQGEWIEITPGDENADWHAWSPSGEILYYESARDGYYCVWAQRLARNTMNPVGPPVAIHHAHSARLSIGSIGPTSRGFAAARDRLVFNMSEIVSNIWMTEFDDAGRGRREGSGR